MAITDLKEASAAAKSVGAIAMADNTFATPINQRPLEHGFDVVLHSATKYLGGHHDVTAGAIVTRTEELWETIWFLYKILGPVLGPLDAHAVRRGIKTLPLRVGQQNETAQALAEFLEDHPKVERVYYPGLKTFPQHALAKRQMDGFGGMLSFEVAGGAPAAVRFLESVELATLAVSLGGADTLVQLAGSITHGPLTDEERARSGISESLVRVSVGLEHVDDLIADFAQALKKAK
jgi:methionine-gamma-lyase